MVKILANDGIAAAGKKRLEDAGFSVDTGKVPQEELAGTVNENNYEIILVRSATRIRNDLIDACPGIRMIGRGGVGMDNIDVKYAREKGIKVFNTPDASSSSVAELTIAHLFSMVRFLYDANRKMPGEGKKEFKSLKKSYSKGIELYGKTLGLIGLGRIGKETAKRATGLGMRVIAYTRSGITGNLQVNLHPVYDQKISIKIEGVSKDQLLKESDFISLHVPFQKGDPPVIGKKELDQIKDGSGLINAARGGVVDENALVEALDRGKLAYAGIDVFENEPEPSGKLLSHPNVSLSPHIGASTGEAQERIGHELADNILEFYNKS